MNFAWRSMAMLPLLLASGSGWAIDLSLCGLDGVLEVPHFALGRDAKQCLLLDPGNGDPSVPFQFEVFNKKGLSVSAKDSGETLAPGLSWIDLYDCPKGVCSHLVWKTTLDNYLSPAGRNDDVLFWGTGQRVKYMLIKDSLIANGWKCGGGAWSGPNGTSCTSEASSSHSDGMQLRGQPVDDGWFVLQDTVFVNGYNLHLLIQASSELGRLGSLVIQGGTYGRLRKVGAATDWIADCEKRSPPTSSGTDICPVGRTSIGSDLRTLWFIDMAPGDGDTRIGPSGTHEKIVVVRTGRTKGNYKSGWPYPLDSYSGGQGPGTCPNGRMPDYKGTPAYCYTSLERAKAVHKLPPFVQLSQSGWANAPSSGGSTRPAAPELLP